MRRWIGGSRRFSVFSAAALYSTCQAKTLLYLCVAVGARALLDARMCVRGGLVIFLVAQEFEHKLVQQPVGRLADAACCTCQRLGKIGVKRLQIAMFGCSDHG